MSGIENVIFERGRQIGKGWNDQAPENANGELAECASYILGDYMEDTDTGNAKEGPDTWPVQRAISNSYRTNDMVYYNDNDPEKAAIMRELIKQGHKEPSYEVPKEASRG